MIAPLSRRSLGARGGSLDNVAESGHPCAAVRHQLSNFASDLGVRTSLIATLCAAASSARAAQPLDVLGEREPREEHAGAHFHNVLALEVAYVEKRLLSSAAEEGAAEDGEAGEGEDAGSDGRSALRIAYERVVLERVLHVELSALLSSAPGGAIEVPLALVIKLPIELSETIEGYVGAGPALELEQGPEHWASLWGLTVAGGVSYWFSPHMGVNVEVEQAWVGPRGSTSEMASAAGAVVRF